MKLLWGLLPPAGKTYLLMVLPVIIGLIIASGAGCTTLYTSGVMSVFLVVWTGVAFFIFAARKEQPA